MKSLLLLAVANLITSNGTKLGGANPKTAFCMTGNVRLNHQENPSRELKARLDIIDPHGLVFAYVNPCEAQTAPWWWGMVHPGQTFAPKECKADPWAGSFWREYMKPTVLKEYRDKDVVPAPRKCKEGSPTWLNGVYQQWKGVQECFKLIEEYEKQHKFKFETVARFRADACHDAGGCDQVKYCNVDKLDSRKAYMHEHSHNGGQPNYFDNFAVLSRQYAEVYFNTLDFYFNDCTQGGPGENLLNHQMWKHKVPTEDKCECHDHHYCAPPGKSVFIERRFLPDLDTYEDMPLFMETTIQPTIHFVNARNENASNFETMKPFYMHLRMSPAL